MAEDKHDGAPLFFGILISLAILGQILQTKFVDPFHQEHGWGKATIWGLMILAVVAVLVVIAFVVGRRKLKEKDKQSKRSRIYRDEQAADALLQSLRKSQAPAPKQRPPVNRAKKEQLECQLATLRRVQQQIPIEHSDERKGNALLQTQKRIVEIQAMLDALTGPTEQASTAPLSEGALLDEAIVRQPENVVLYARRAWHLSSRSRNSARAMVSSAGRP